MPKVKHILTIILLLSAVSFAQTFYRAPDKLRSARRMVIEYRAHCSTSPAFSRDKNKVCANKDILGIKQGIDSFLEEGYKSDGTPRPAVAKADPDILLIIHSENPNIRSGDAVVSLTIYDAVDNKELWSESRNRVNLSNDVKRLLIDFQKAYLGEQK